MEEKLIQKAARQFGQGTPQIEILGAGLIHRTYKVLYPEARPPARIVLQCINQLTFPNPELIIRNYKLISDYLSHQTEIIIPAMINTLAGHSFFRDPEGHFWRATAFIENSYAPAVARSPKDAFEAARCFASFTRALKDIDIGSLEIIIPGFHNLAARYRQFSASVTKASPERKTRSKDLLEELTSRENLVEFYNGMIMDPAYPLRVMHHDCKISNMLFWQDTGETICPVDLDTVMPGYFFSDVGDMIRSMACSADENCIDLTQIEIIPGYYKAIIEGYLLGMGQAFSEKEIMHIHHAGLLMIYMQSLRFITDYLNNDIYYHTNYPDQNYDRALNQLVLLKKLETFLLGEYAHRA